MNDGTVKKIPKFERRGKPRRGRLPALRVSARLDPDAKKALTDYFGSLGNALYFLYEGIERTKEEESLPSEVEKIEKWKLHQFDFEIIYMALLHYTKCQKLDGKSLRPYVRLIEKLSHSFKGEMYDEAPEDY